MRPLLRVALASLFVLAFRPAAANEVNLVTLDWPPYSGAVPNQGFLSVVLREAYATQGHSVSVKVLPWLRAIKVTMSGARNSPLGFYSASQQECTDANGRTSDPIGYYQFYLAQRKGGQSTWRQWSDLHGKRIGVIEGYDNGPDIARLGSQSLIVLDAAPNDLSSLQKLAAKRVDYAVTDARVFEHLQKVHSLTSLELAARPVTGRLPLYVCFNRTPSAEAMRLVLNEGLKQVNVETIAQTYLRPASR
ncbi:MAG: transporter substrate-binding domain-containing protein [Rhodoferax sp.]|uniref:substrate-binding periplasmic protein n=1 Tax=Rhodoferax sp. TaxID=50421 RepID=UPI002ACEB820|nr:transporter substrate-binding domain-containing protein [Rhodoferax sp.]MDZ7890885.1 transporter substrate-binding domain-containing protein [Rhodoferax sp.]